jgi:Fe-S-cluster-containing dehydrogenase component
MDESRRTFLKTAGCAILGAGLVAPIARTVGGAVRMEAAPGELTAKRWAIAVDIKKCLERKDCHACIDACHVAHNVPLIKDPLREIKWIWKDSFQDTFAAESHPHLENGLAGKSVLVLCNHCDNPPCVRVCPTKATWKRPDGIVMMDQHRCIGCRYCIAGCPYGSRSFNWQDPRPFITTGINPDYPTRTKGVVEKCTLCTERLVKGLPPVCVEVCNKVAGPGTMTFGDIRDPDSEVARVLKGSFSIRRKPELGTEPQIFYLV